MSWRRRDKSKKIALVIALVISVLGICYWYAGAYKDSAEAITLSVYDKWTDHHTDEDGFTSTSYVVVGNGEEFNCKKGAFHQFRTGERYEVVVAGLGVFRRDVVAVNRHIPKPKPKPVLIRVDEPESEH